MLDCNTVPGCSPSLILQRRGTGLHGSSARRTYCAVGMTTFRVMRLSLRLDGFRIATWQRIGSTLAANGYAREYEFGFDVRGTYSDSIIFILISTSQLPGS